MPLTLSSTPKKEAASTTNKSALPLIVVRVMGKPLVNDEAGKAISYAITPPVTTEPLTVWPALNGKTTKLLPAESVVVDGLSKPTLPTVNEAVLAATALGKKIANT